jgi:threonine dehydratase
MAFAFTYLRIVLDPAGAVALAAALFRLDLPDTVIVTASGGTTDPEIFARALGML